MSPPYGRGRGEGEVGRGPDARPRRGGGNGNVFEGSWGPDSCMTAALAGYTPNTSGARFGCSDTIDVLTGGTTLEDGLRVVAEYRGV